MLFTTFWPVQNGPINSSIKDILDAFFTEYAQILVSFAFIMCVSSSSSKPLQIL
jgi:hypothetical protein